MSINEFRTYALRTLCEEHLWKPLESDFFTLRGREYRIMMEPDGTFTLTTRVSKHDMWPAPKTFPTMGRLFVHLFRSCMISYN